MMPILHWIYILVSCSININTSTDKKMGGWRKGGIAGKNLTIDMGQTARTMFKGEKQISTLILNVL